MDATDGVFLNIGPQATGYNDQHLKIYYNNNKAANSNKQAQTPYEASHWHGKNTQYKLTTFTVVHI